MRSADLHNKTPPLEGIAVELRKCLEDMGDLKSKLRQNNQENKTIKVILEKIQKKQPECTVSVESVGAWCNTIDDHQRCNNLLIEGLPEGSPSIKRRTSRLWPL